MKIKCFSNLSLMLIFFQVYTVQADSPSDKSTFKLGFNSNYIYGNGYFEDGYTGFGFFFEPYFSNNFSLVFSYNSFELAETSYQPFKTREAYILIRHNWQIQDFNFYPESGFGTWGSHGSYFAFGLGLDYSLIQNVIVSSSIDYLIVGHQILDPGGSGWIRNVFKLYFGVSYKFNL